MLLNAFVEQRRSLFSAFGLERSDANCALCELYAAPFIHGPALAAELQFLNNRLGHFPEENEMRTAHAQLHQMVGALSPVTVLEALEDDLAGACSDTIDLAGMIETAMERENELASRRVRLSESARREAEQDRTAFEEALAERRQAADIASDCVASVADARQLHFRSMANSVIGEIHSVSQAWQELIR